MFFPAGYLHCSIEIVFVRGISFDRFSIIFQKLKNDFESLLFCRHFDKNIFNF